MSTNFWPFNVHPRWLWIAPECVRMCKWCPAIELGLLVFPVFLEQASDTLTRIKWWVKVTPDLNLGLYTATTRYLMHPWRGFKLEVDFFYFSIMPWKQAETMKRTQGCSKKKSHFPSSNYNNRHQFAHKPYRVDLFVKLTTFYFVWHSEQANSI